MHIHYYILETSTELAAATTGSAMISCIPVSVSRHSADLELKVQVSFDGRQGNTEMWQELHTSEEAEP